MHELDTSATTEPKKRHKVWKVLRYTLLGILLFSVCLILILRMPLIQTHLAQKFGDYLSEETNTNIQIGRLDVSGLLKIKLFDFIVYDQEDSLMIDSKSINIDLELIKLFNNQIHINSITLDSTYFALLENSSDSILNLNKILEFFSSEDTTSTPLNMQVNVDRLELIGAHYRMKILSAVNYDEGGMNYTRLDINNANIIVSDFTIEGDTLIGNIEHLSVHEKCGFIINEFKGQVRLSSAGLYIKEFELQTPSSWAYSDFSMKYNQWPDWLNFIENVRFDAKIDSAQLNLEDIQYFATTMEGMQDTLLLSGKVRGPISNMKLRNGEIYFKNNTHFIGDVNMTGLPDIEHTFMLIKAKDFKTTYTEISQFYLPGKESITLPEEIIRLGRVQIKGRFTGFYNDFVSNANFNTDLGKLTTDIILKPHQESSKEIGYQGRLSAYKFDLGGLLLSERYGEITMEANINGIGLNKNAEANYKIDIEEVEISKYNYLDVKIDGKIINERIEAFVLSDDGDFKLTALGYFDYHDSLPEYDLKLNVEKARIARLLMLSEDTLGVISGKVDLNMIGDHLDNINGAIKLDSLIYTIDSTSYFADDLLLTTTTNENLNRQIDIQSKWLDALIKGQFSIAELELTYGVIFNNILPSLIETLSLKPVHEIDKSIVKEGDFLDFHFKFKDTKDLHSIFAPASHLANGSSLDGFFNFEKDSMVLDFYTPKISYDQFYAKELQIYIHKPSKSLSLDIESQFIRAKNITGINSLELRSYIELDTVEYAINWGKVNNYKKSGNLSGRLAWTEDNVLIASFNESEIWTNDTLWELSNTGKVKYSYHLLEVKDFRITSNENRIEVDGTVSENPNDSLRFEFLNFDLSLFDFYLVDKFKTNLDGLLTGQFKLSSLWTNVSFNSNLEIKDFQLNQSYLGDAIAQSSYIDTLDGFIIDMELQNTIDSIPYKYIDLNGYYYPKNTENSLDIIAKLDTYPLQSIESYLTSFSSDIYGTIDGDVTITGTLAEPLILGALDADVERLKIDYIGTTYHFNEKMVFKKDYFGFDSIKVFDANYSGGEWDQALATIQIQHENYSSLGLNIDVSPNRMTILELEENEDRLFYGHARGIGNLRLYGPLNELTMRMDIESIEGSKISIPFASEVIAEKADFITFIQKNDTIVIEKNEDEVEDVFSLDLDMSIKVTPRTQIELVMDEVVGDIITARGSGSIRMTYDREDNFLMYGKYNIERGDYLFTMQNILNKHFRIQPGSYLFWDGSPEKAEINIKAIYKTEAKLYDLIQQVDPSDEFKKLSKVDCIINITGDLYSPNISFDIQVPEENTATREIVKQLLTLSNGQDGNQELNKNFISLLVIRKFQPPSGYSSDETTADALSKNATETVANQVGNILNKLSEDVEIGLNWNPGDEVTTTEVAIALSYSMLDDRLVIDGKFGSGGGSTTEGSDRIIGDLNVEYKFTKDGRIRGKVFNRTNYYDPLSRKAPYTQGVGIVYRKEFDNTYELFHRTKIEQEEIDRNEESARIRKEERAIKKEKNRNEREKRRESRKRKKENKAVKPKEEVESES